MSANEFKGQEGQTPEWFSLVESDTRIQKNRRDRGIRVMALAGPLLLISAGLLFAQTNEGQNASATDNTSIAAPATSGNSEIASSASADAGVATNPVATGSSDSSGSTPATATSAASGEGTVSASNGSAAPHVAPSHSQESVKPAKPGATISTPSTTPGFTPPVATAPQSSSDDDSVQGSSGHGEDDDAYEHGDSEEGDDD